MYDFQMTWIYYLKATCNKLSICWYWWFDLKVPSRGINYYDIPYTAGSSKVFIDKIIIDFSCFLFSIQGMTSEDVVFTIKMVHSQCLGISTVQVVYEDEVSVLAHLVAGAQLPTSAQVRCI